MDHNPVDKNILYDLNNVLLDKSIEYPSSKYKQFIPTTDCVQNPISTNVFNNFVTTNNKYMNK